MTDTDRTAEGRRDKNPDTIAPGTDRSLSAPSLGLDIALYERYLEDADLTPEQKREFLEALWMIVTEFVLLGFGVHPIHQAQETCGKLKPNAPKAPISAPDRVKLNNRKSVDIFSTAIGSKYELNTQGGQE